MGLLKVKNGANLVLSVEMAICLGWVARRWVEAGLGELVVTSGREGAHKQGSLHYSGNAVDIRPWDHWDWTDIHAQRIYAVTGQLPQGNIWKRMGHHSDEIVQFALMLKNQRVGMRL